VIVPTPANPECAPTCLGPLNWHLPADTRCGDGSPAPGATSVGGSGATSASPASSGGKGSGCGPAPNCGGRAGCTAVGYQCLNGQWIGGHCECKKLP
jgi:hypothetical protein